MELSPIANDKLHALFERVKTQMHKGLRLDPIFLGKTDPEFIKKFLVLKVDLENMEFISETIRETIHRDFTHLYLIGLKNSGLDIKMWYFTKSPFLPSDMKRAKGIFKRTIIVRKLLSLPSNYVDELTFYIFPTDYRKVLPDQRGATLGPMHCNSGSTDIARKEIALWRIEEMNKVLIHELLHHYSVDANLMDISTDLNLGETYTEWLTTILYSMFESIEKGKHYRTFKRRLADQVKFSLYQAAKIVYHYQLELTKTNLNAEHVPFHQDTNVYEYYILKAALLYHMSLVIRHMDPETLVFRYPLEFLQTVMESLDERFIDALDKILAKNIKFTRTLKMVL